MALELDNVALTYTRRGRPPVSPVAGVSLRIDRGEVVGLVGESGSGKSSLGKLAVGLVAPTAGTIRHNGKPISVVGPSRRPTADLTVQMVFQNAAGSLNPQRRVGSQIADGIRRRGGSAEAQRLRTLAIIDRLGMPSRVADAYPDELSGGQRQRVAIARALSTDPEILVLDEPLSSLDASAQAQVANLLHDLAKSDGLGVLLISHDLSVVKHVAARVVVMYLGVIVEESRTDDLWRLPLHPYTEALIKSAPNAGNIGLLPPTLPGEVGDPANPPPGCRFNPRCPYVMERCRSDVPMLTDCGTDRKVACWLRSPDPTASETNAKAHLAQQLDRLDEQAAQPKRGPD